MKNKKGFIRILEVMFAIMILGGAIIYVYTSKVPEQVSVEEYVSIYQKKILTEISLNDTLRQMVLDGNRDELNNYIQLPYDLNYTIEICDMTTASGYCNMDENIRAYLYNKNVHEFYSDETIIASDYDDYSPKKVKIFIWQTF